MKKLFKSILILSILIQFQVIPLSGETREKSLEDKTDAAKEKLYEPQNWIDLIKTGCNELDEIDCLFNYVKKDEHNPVSATQQPTSKPTISIPLKTIPSSVPNGCEGDTISRLLHINQQKCLNATIWSSKYLEKLLTLVNCDNSAESQQWLLRNGSYICTLQDQCLAVKPGKSNPEYMDPALMTYNEALESKQQWSIDDKNKIIHTQSGWRLSLGYLIDGRVDLVHKGTVDDKNQGWSFEPILFEGVFKCDNNN